MTWLVLSLTIFAVAFIGVVWAHRRAHREVRLVVPTDLAARIETATRAFVDAPPWQPASDPRAPEVAAAIEAALIANDPARALELAEGALAASPDAAAPSAAGTKLWLAWALVANGQPAAALAQLASPSASPPPSPAPSPSPSAATSPLATYLTSRAEHLHFEHIAGATDAVPALVTTADLAVVTLASGRGAATWLKGTTDVELSAAQAKAAIAEHRDVTARCLSRALDALEAAPGFADAAYLVARLAVKAGLLAQARPLFEALAPRMTGRPDADAFERDRKDLANPASAVAAAKLPPLPPMAGKAKRSRSLKVL
ncbi:MAG: tetratricopeptide repeat protein [Myxococcota bacterium]|nr:tetratricopeptide repeat protein [Myxococcota bacterium]